MKNIEKLLLESNEVLRSTYQIALRNGRDTNWESFRNMVDTVLNNQHLLTNGLRKRAAETRSVLLNTLDVGGNMANEYIFCAAPDGKPMCVYGPWIGTKDAGYCNMFNIIQRYTVPYGSVCKYYATPAQMAAQKANKGICHTSGNTQRDEINGRIL